MSNPGYMTDLFEAFKEAGAELDCLERLGLIATEAGQPALSEMLAKLASRCEEKIGELQRELVAAGWSDE